MSHTDQLYCTAMREAAEEITRESSITSDTKNISVSAYVISDTPSQYLKAGRLFPSRLKKKKLSTARQQVAFANTIERDGAGSHRSLIVSLGKITFGFRM